MEVPKNTLVNSFYPDDSIDAGLLWPNGMEGLYYDHRVDAGELALGDFQPDLSFFSDDGFRRIRNNPDERIIFETYDMSTISQKRFVVGFGGVHSHDPQGKLFASAGDAFDKFIKIIDGERERAICILEGGIRGVDLTWSDKRIFALHGEIGMMEALARRAGIRVTGAEPLLGLNFLAKEYGAGPVLDYMKYRLYPQLHLIDRRLRPNPSAYVASVFRSRPYLSSFRYLAGIDEYIQELEADALSPAAPLPDREECLRQTTYEYIVDVPEDQRTITQEIAYRHNWQRDRRLYSDTLLYSGHFGLHVLYSSGDVHIRALHEAHRSDAENMRIGRGSANKRLVFPPRRWI